MKTQIKKIGDTIVVSMDGRLDYETNEPLQADLKKLLTTTKTDSVPKKIIVNMEKLDFVGSSGISNFVQTLKNFNTSAPSKPRYCNVKNEFKKVIKAFDEDDGFEFFDNEERAKKSFDN